MSEKYPYKKLSNLINLDEDWDGYGGKTPKPEVIETAKKFLQILEKNDEAIPNVFADNGGEVVFYWKKSKYYLEVFFDSQNKFSYYIDMDGDFHSEDDCLLDRIFCSTFLKYLAYFKDERLSSSKNLAKYLNEEYLGWNKTQLETFAQKPTMKKGMVLISQKNTKEACMDTFSLSEILGHSSLIGQGSSLAI